MTRSLSGSRPAAAAVWSFASVLAAVGALAEEVELMPPYIPTVQDDVDLMLDVGGVGPGDYVIDLGSGDGRIVITAAKRGAFGHGVEIDADLVDESARIAEAEGVADRTAFVEADIFEADVSQATVVTLYLYPEINLRLRPKLLSELRPGTRVLSNSFDMNDWKPDVHDMSARSSGGILMWVVPAGVAGDWQIELDGDDTRDGEGARFELNVTQRFQQVNLRLGSVDERLAIRSAELRGERLSFIATTAGSAYAFSGRVDGDRIAGIVQVQDGDDEIRVRRWRASRAPERQSLNRSY
jgi:hypothetical protein